MHRTASSGDMYAGVPPLTCSASPAMLGQQLGVIKTEVEDHDARPSGVTSTLDGLMSR